MTGSNRGIITMSILDSVKNAFKGLARSVDSGDGGPKSVAPSVSDSIAATKYLKEGDGGPLQETARKNVNVAALLGVPRCAQERGVNLCRVEAARINQNAKELLKEPRVRAMLDTIAYAEGTGKDPDGGYGRVVKGTVVRAPGHPELVGQRNVTTSDFSGHPNVMVRVNPGDPPKKWSTAAGRYQFLLDTWNGLNLPDFGSESQDIGAVKLLNGRGSLVPLLNDDFEKAILNSNREWASFPKSPYGQPTRTMEQLKAFYNEALSSYRL